MNLTKIKNAILAGLVFALVGGAISGAAEKPPFFVEIGYKVSRVKEELLGNLPPEIHDWHCKALKEVSNLDRKLNPGRPERESTLGITPVENEENTYERSFNIAKYTISATCFLSEDKKTTKILQKDQNLLFLSAGFLNEELEQRVKGAFGSTYDYMVMSKFYQTNSAYPEHVFRKYFIDLFEFKSCLSEKVYERKKKEGVELYKALEEDTQKDRSFPIYSYEDLKKDIQRQKRKLLLSREDYLISSDTSLLMGHLFLETGFDDLSNVRARALISKAAWGIYPDPLSRYYMGDGRNLGLILPDEGVVGSLAMGYLDTDNLPDYAYDKSKKPSVLGLKEALSYKTADNLFGDFPHYFYHSEQIIMQYLIHNISTQGVPAWKEVMDELWKKIKKKLPPMRGNKPESRGNVPDKGAKGQKKGSNKGSEDVEEMIPSLKKCTESLMEFQKKYTAEEAFTKSLEWLLAENQALDEELKKIIAGKKGLDEQLKGISVKKEELDEQLKGILAEKKEADKKLKESTESEKLSFERQLIEFQQAITIKENEFDEQLSKKQEFVEKLKASGVEQKLGEQLKEISAKKQKLGEQLEEISAEEQKLDEQLKEISAKKQKNEQEKRDLLEEKQKSLNESLKVYRDMLSKFDDATQKTKVFSGEAKKGLELRRKEINNQLKGLEKHKRELTDNFQLSTKSLEDKYNILSEHINDLELATSLIGKSIGSVQEDISDLKVTYEGCGKNEWFSLYPDSELSMKNGVLQLDLEICSHRVICPVCATSFFYDLNLRKNSFLKEKIAEAVSRSLITKPLLENGGLFNAILQSDSFDCDYLLNVATLKYMVKKTIVDTEQDVRITEELFKKAEMRVLISSEREI